MPRRPVARFTVALSLALVPGIALPLAAQSRRSTRTAAAPPAPAPAPARLWSTVSAGGAHSCALDNTGRSYCWGENAWRRLGITDSVNQRRAVAVETPQRFRAIQAGVLETCAVTNEGSAVCWGGELPGTAPHASFGELRFRTLDISTNGCGVGRDGIAWCWGSNSSGQLGSGRATAAWSTAPERVAGDRRWRQVVTGVGYGCGVTEDDDGYCWGSAALLGNGTGRSSRVPVAIGGGHSWKQLAAGTEHVCGLTVEGAAWCWGANTYGTLGNGQTQNAGQPVPVAGSNVFKELAAGNDFTCGLTTQARVYCWGWNQFGVLGTGTTSNAAIPTRVAGEASLMFISISAGPGHLCGVAANGGIYCWGDNAEGALGIARSQSCRSSAAGRTETRACAMVPTRIQDPR